MVMCVTLIFTQSIPDVLQTPSLHSNGTRQFRFTSPANQTADLSDESEMEDYFHSDSDESADLSQSSSSSYSSESDDSPDDASDSESEQDSTVPSDSESDQDTTGPKRQPGRPRAQVGTEADTPRNAQRRVRYQERSQEDRLEDQWRTAVAAKRDAEAQELCAELLQTRRGATLFPAQAKIHAELKATKLLAKNVSEFNKEMGARSKHRRVFAIRVTKGLPPAFCQKILGFNPSSLRKFNQRDREDSSKPALFSEGRNDEKGRASFSPTFEREVGKFFESRTAILSGANTHTRKLLMPKARFEAEFHAEVPAILRRAVLQDSNLRPDVSKPDRILTAMQKNVLAAEYACTRDAFSEAEEYRLRLDAYLQR